MANNFILELRQKLKEEKREKNDNMDTTLNLSHSTDSNVFVLEKQNEMIPAVNEMYKKNQHTCKYIFVVFD